MNDTVNEVRVRSIPTAAALVCAGFDVRRVAMLNGVLTFCFPAEAMTALTSFTFAKQRLDQLAEGVTR
jgi:hypothetical protein